MRRINCKRNDRLRGEEIKKRQMSNVKWLGGRAGNLSTPSTTSPQLDANSISSNMILSDEVQPIEVEKWKPSFGRRERRKTEPAGAPARKDQKFDDLLQNGTIERTDPGFFTRSAEQHIKATIFAIKPLRQRSTNLPKHAAAFRDFHYLYPCPDIDSQQRSSNSCTTIPNSNKDDRRKSSVGSHFVRTPDCSNRRLFAVLQEQLRFF
ncbi:hypothetical protein CDAR_542001 [Caerostris darwini]|uniref:Uncharacterized protein n=1 Tax=Caerostris darwini TaxID=1538125 RepID=A0AAV4UU62_9ARAC|nr:hypothetical protein CDAR_542001 [Caerostris darwini]